MVSEQVLIQAKSSASKSLANTVAELLWIQSLLTELHISFQSPKILCDNISTVTFTHNPVLHTRTKHMALDIFFVREKVLNKSLVVQHIPSQIQRADIFTKALSTERFLELKDKLRVFDEFYFVQPP